MPITKPFVKTFDQLDTNELHEIIKNRVEVFVVEQNCPYQDVDDYDLQSLHVAIPFEGKLGAYCRIVPPGLKFPEWAIGRVLTAPHARGQKLAHTLIKMALEATNNAPNRISAQTYLQKFYESHGFVHTGKSYLEDDQPHIEMLRS